MSQLATKQWVYGGWNLYQILMISRTHHHIMQEISIFHWIYLSVLTQAEIIVIYNSTAGELLNHRALIKLLTSYNENMLTIFVLFHPWTNKHKGNRTMKYHHSHIYFVLYPIHASRDIKFKPSYGIYIKRPVDNKGRVCSPIMHYSHLTCAYPIAL